MEDVGFKIQPLLLEVVSHTLCDLGRISSVYNAPSSLLNAITGLELREIGVYNSMMCSYTIAEADKRSQERYFSVMGYIVIAGIYSDKQLA